MTQAIARKDEHAEANAHGWTDTIRQMVAALECDRDRLEELTDEHRALVEAVDEAGGELETARTASPDDAKVYALQGEYDDAEAALNDWKEVNGEELADLEAATKIDGDEMKDADAVRERIEESPLSVQVRSGWAAPGEEMVAEEFELLLSTGGPALRIMGELDEHKQPSRAWLEYQDWGTPWTHHYVEDFSDTLLTFCQQFYFGE